jgi:hypothetical protein
VAAECEDAATSTFSQTQQVFPSEALSLEPGAFFGILLETLTNHE